MPTPLLENRQLGPDVQRGNLLVNGGFEIWQRGNGPFSINVVNADRWQAQQGNVTVTRDTANTDGSTACAAVTYTPGGSETWPGLLQQAANDNPQLLNRVLSFSVRVKTSVANVRPFIQTDPAGTRAYGSPHPADGAYHTLTVTTTPISVCHCGVQFTVGTGGTAYIDNAMLVVGSQPANYVPLHPADDLARCQRYYERVDATNAQYVVNGFSFDVTMCRGMWPLRVSKATSPTVTASPPSTWVVTNGAFAPIVCTDILVWLQATQMVAITGVVPGGLTVGQGGMIAAGASQNASLVIEANP